MADEPDTKTPALLTLPPKLWVTVSDADEEIFELYTKLAGSSDSEVTDSVHQHKHKQRPTQLGSLGFLDSGSSTLTVKLQIHPPLSNEDSSSCKSRQKNKKSSGKKNRRALNSGQDIQVEIKQDVFAINYRSGDTGSIVWRASVYFAELLWYSLLFPPPPPLSLNKGEDENEIIITSLLDMKKLTNSSHILELGAGTASLSVLCRQIFPLNSRSSWTCSDQFSLLNTISKNFVHNQIPFATTTTTTTITTTHDNNDIDDQRKKKKEKEKTDGKDGCQYFIEEIDWIQVEKLWLKINSNSSSTSRLHKEERRKIRKYDVILAIDCLYNETLIDPLLRTIDYFSRPSTSTSTSSTSRTYNDTSEEETGATLVVVVSELRSDLVLSHFLNNWLLLNDPPWNIIRIPQATLRLDLDLHLSHPNYVVWCGWKI